LKQQRQRFQTEMALIDLQAKTSEHEMQRLENEVHRFTLSGHQSEPTTPPEYREPGFPSAISRPNRLSLASLTSPPKTNSFGTTHRNTLSGSHHRAPSASVISPDSDPSQSVPGSRRNSDEEDEEGYDFEVATVPRRSAV
jgi:hypothetical protein